MSLGIVGTGISGLHLALRLQQFDVPVTLYAEQTPEDLRSGPPLNFVTRFGSTRDRERALGITRWASSAYDNPWMHVYVEGPEPLAFRGRLPVPASTVDFRLYLPELLEEYQRRGGRVARREVSGQHHLAELAKEHDLLVVAAGRGALVSTFERDPARSPYLSAPRLLTGGLFRGIRPPEPEGMTMHMVPGAGEVHAPPFHTFDGRLTALLVEAIPGGPFSAFAGRDYRQAPDVFAKDILALLAEHAPALRERVDEREFGLARPVDMLRGAIVPTVRHNWVRLPEGTHALAIGDAWITNDPLTAQGANLGSRMAFELADAVRRHQGHFDEAFCRTVSAQLWRAAQPVVDWTNMFLDQPPPQLRTLLGAAASDQRVAHAFARNMDDPSAMWHAVARPEHTEEFIARVRDVRSGV